MSKVSNYEIRWAICTSLPPVYVQWVFSLAWHRVSVHLVGEWGDLDCLMTAYQHSRPAPLHAPCDPPAHWHVCWQPRPRSARNLYEYPQQQTGPVRINIEYMKWAQNILHTCKFTWKIPPCSLKKSQFTVSEKSWNHLNATGKSSYHSLQQRCLQWVWCMDAKSHHT